MMDGGALFRMLLAGAVMVAFAVELCSLIRRADDPGAFAVLFGTLVTVTVGEALNLMVTRVAIYPGTDSFPLYIVLGGALVGLSWYRAAGSLAQRLGRDRRLARLGCALLLSIIFPVMEMAGITLGLWAWSRPCDFQSPDWWLGVWRFYLAFVAGPALLILLARPASGTRRTEPTET